MLLETCYHYDDIDINLLLSTIYLFTSISLAIYFIMNYVMSSIPVAVYYNLLFIKFADKLWRRAARVGMMRQIFCFTP